MNEDDDTIPPGVIENAALAELTEQITCRLEAGERLELVGDGAQFTGCPAAVQELVPLLRDLVEVGRSVARERRQQTQGDGSRIQGTPDCT